MLPRNPPFQVIQRVLIIQAAELRPMHFLQEEQMRRNPINPRQLTDPFIAPFVGACVPKQRLLESGDEVHHAAIL